MLLVNFEIPDPDQLPLLNVCAEMPLPQTPVMSRVW